MKKGNWAIIALLAVCIVSTAQAQDALEQPISIRVKNVLLEKALFTLIKDAGVRLSFSNDIIPEKQVSLKARQQALQKVLDNLLQNTDLGYRQIGDQIVLYKMTVVPTPEARHTISGYVEAQETGERLIGAQIWDFKRGKGVETNEYGFFSITLPAGEIQLSIFQLGYVSSKENLLLQNNQQVTFALKSASTLPEVEVIAHDSLTKGLKSGTSVTNFDTEELERLPALGGEADLVRAAHFLPGVQTGADGIGGIHVRGGSPEQNLVLMDGVPVYNVQHAGGLFSIFNTDAIRSAQLYKGGFPARYGGRLSSVLDIHTKDGNMKHLSGQVEAGLLTFKGSLEGPLIKDKASFFISGRHSFINWYLDDLSRKEKALQGEQGETAYAFYDINAKINYIVSQKDRIYLSIYQGKDNFDNNGFHRDTIQLFRNYHEDTLNFHHDNWYSEWLRWGNTVAAGRWNHLFSNKLFANTTLTYSRFWTDIYYGSGDSLRYINKGETIFKKLDSGRYRSSIEDIGGRMDFDYVWSPSHTTRFGVNVTQHQLNPGALVYDEANEARSEEAVQSNDPIHSYEYAAYAESNLTPGTSWSVNIGVHAARLQVQNKNYYSLQPRFSTYWRAGSHLGFKASAGRMTQFLHLLSNSSIGLPTDLWVPATAKVPPQDAWQASIGADYSFNKLEVSIETYYKKMTNLLNYTEGAFFLNDWEDNVTTGNGRAYGVETFIRKSVGKSKGWIAYTLSWADRQFERVNLGRRYPYRYDRRHDLKIVLQHSFYKWLNVSADWSLSSGFAYSLPVSEYAYPVAGGSTVPVTNFGAKNQFRMPLYQRLDLNAQATFNTKRLLHTINIGLYNAYNHQNPLYYDIRTQIVKESDELKERKEYTQVLLLPMLPSVSYSVRF